MVSALFQIGHFTFHSGQKSWWKVECDALTAEDWRTLARLIFMGIPEVSAVEGVPTGGLKLAAALEQLLAYEAGAPVLIVDDVWTTGRSMTDQRAGRANAVGYVAFAHTRPAPWCRALWTLGIP